MDDCVRFKCLLKAHLFDWGCGAKTSDFCLFLCAIYLLTYLLTYLFVGYVNL